MRSTGTAIASILSVLRQVIVNARSPVRPELRCESRRQPGSMRIEASTLFIVRTSRCKSFCSGPAVPWPNQDYSKFRTRRTCRHAERPPEVTGRRLHHATFLSPGYPVGTCSPSPLTCDGPSGSDTTELSAGPSLPSIEAAPTPSAGRLDFDNQSQTSS